MQPYFTWKGHDSRIMGLWVQQLPPITRPPMRYQEITIPGRPGALTLLEGTDIYEPYVREMKIMPRPGADIYAIMRWLTGSGQIVFSNEPDRKQTARIYDEVSFQKEFATQRSAVIRFLCDPFKESLYDTESISVDLTQSSYTLACQGDVIAYPKFELTGTGSCSLYVNSNEIAFTDLDNTAVTVDCESRTAYTQVVDQYFDTHIVPVTTHGDFFTLYHTGSMLVRWSEGITELTIYPRWRWF